MEISPLIYNLLVTGCAAIISLIVVPKIVNLSFQKGLFDVPDNHRKLHKRIVPNLGGVAIFIGFIITAILFIKNPEEKWHYVAASVLIMFFTGLKDDLVTIKPIKKLIAQVVAAAIVVVMADIRLQDFFGLVGLHHLPVWFSYLFSIVGITFVTNAFNLIDGIDGLAGSTAAVATLILGMLFAFGGEANLAVISFSLLGATLGFLYFNISPARIFMGDTGSLFIGFALSTLSIMLVNSPGVFLFLKHSLHVAAGPAIKYTIVLAILFVPVFDTFRVFVVRIFKGHSPFQADRTHLHHYLLDLGFSHNQTVLILLSSSTVLFFTCALVDGLNVHLGIAAMVFVAGGLFAILFFARRQLKKGTQREQPVNHSRGQLMTHPGATVSGGADSFLTTRLSRPVDEVKKRAVQHQSSKEEVETVRP